MAALKLEPLFTELDQFIKDANYQQALATSEKIRKLSPTDEDALVCQCGCLIQLGQCDRALELLDSEDKEGKLAFQRAYCLYSLRRYTEALKQLEALPDRSTRVLELEAQVRYGLEDYSKSVALYEELLANNKNPSGELKTNYLAALNLAKQTDKCINNIIKNEASAESFEFAYNAGCSYISAGDLAAAEKELKRSEKICRDSYSGDDEASEELDHEIAIVLVQLGYVYQLQGKHDEAMKLYTAALKNKPSDDVVSVVASNNIVAMNKDKDLFDSEKRLKVALGEKVQMRLTRAQKQVIDFNHSLLLLYMGKLKQCTELVESLRERFPDSPMLSLILASLLFRTKKVEESEDLLKSEIQKYKDSPNSAKLLLSLAQIHFSKQKRDLDAVINTLRSFPSLRQKPGIVSLLVLLLEHQGDIKSAVELLDQCAATYAGQKKLRENQMKDYIAVLKAAGEFKMKHGLYEEAAKSYATLVQLDKNDVESLSNLVLVAAEVNPQQAEEYISRIPSIKIDASLNAEGLENLPAPTLSSIRRTEEREVVAGGEVPAKTKSEKPKKKKKRKPRLPKNYDPTSTAKPDPERWLPKKERSYYRPRRGASSVRRGAQGSSSTSTKAQASSSTTTTTTSSPSPTASSTTTTSKGASGSSPAPAGTSAPKKNQGKQHRRKGRR